MSDRLARRILIWLGIGLLAIWLIREVWGALSGFGSVLALFFSAWLISFVLGPPTNGLVRLGVRRPLAVLSVYFFVFAGLTMALLLLTPVLTSQLGQLLETVNSYTAQTPGMLTWLETQARAFGISDAELRDFYRGLVDQVRVLTGTTLQNAIGWVAGIATVLVNIVFCLIISVYLMLDGRRIVAGALTLTPRPYRPQMTGILQSINDNFGGFIRGQLILAVVYALGVAFVMWVSGLNYKAISAIFAAVAMLIPFVGPFISIIPPLLIALFSNPGDVWWVALLLIIMQQLVLNVVGPRVFGHTVNMHPLLVIGSALAGASVAGIWGALFGIPVAGIVASIVRRVYLNQQTRDAALSTASQPAALATEVTDAATPSDDAAPRPPGVPARRRDSA